nr:PREDICTED: uncharacterized protein LOC105679969 [Linepithema humile]
MAADCVDGDYLGAYSRFFTDFIARVNPDDQLPVKVSAYDVNESELVGEIISVTLQYLNQTYCPPSLQSYIVHLVIQAIKSTCKKQPEICGLRQQEKTYAPLKLMQAITNSVNEICRRYLDNSRLALLPPPSPTQQVSVGATRNARRKMEDRHVVLHDLHTIFNIQDDTIANYYAVFDGHGGQDAAAYCATHLHQYLAESVYYPTDPERALRDAFLTTDAQFIAKSSTQKLNGGTTAVCVLVLNKKLYIAWVGDSMASLVTCGNVKQLVNPHRPTREDECERIQNLGGVLVHCMGVLRVNGFLSISRAIGDVSYKPYISGEPEIRCVPLDGAEDFLIIACDGLWDFVDPRTAALRVYRQVLQNPHDLKYVQQALLQSAKRAGSLDNITVIVVFLTPPIEIASRHSHLAKVPNGLLLNNMDPNNPVSSNPGQFDVNAAFIKQQQQQQQQQLHADLQHATGFDVDINRAIYGTARNGKHQDNDDDYDYSGDLGPETDVDAIEDVDPDVGYRNASRELFPESEKSEKSVKNEEFSNASNNDKNDNDDDGDLNRDNANVCPVDPVVDVDNRVRPSDRDVRDADDEAPRGNDDGDARVESAGTHTVVDNDESPPSPRATKPLQHALIPEAENVADSEDSEDEWNYYRVDPNKGESVAAAVTAEKTRKGVEELSVQEKNIAESIEKDSSEFQSPEINKCEKLEKEISSKLVNIDISDKEKPSESVKDLISIGDQDQNAGDMDFQLNPEAAEFVPLSSPLLSNRNFLQDYPISGSPLKQTPAMDDIPVPSQSEFEQEVCRRPREIDEKDCASDDQQVNNDQPDLDVSDVSSTKVEVGDVSTTLWPVDISSQWSEKTRDSAKLNSEEYDIVDKNNPMMMSFEPDEFAAAFKKDLDLNAVHDLSDSSESEENKAKSEESDGSEPDRLSRSPILIANDERVHTPFSDDKDAIDLLCTSSTPQPPADTKEVSSASSDMKDMLSFITENRTEQLENSSLMDDSRTRTTQLESSLITSEIPSDLNSSKNTDELKSTTSFEDELQFERSRADTDPFNDSNLETPPLSLVDSREREIAEEHKILKILINKGELAGENSNYHDEYLEKANALLKEQNRLCESDDEEAVGVPTETLLFGDLLSKPKEQTEELEGRCSDTEVEKLYAQNNVDPIIKGEHRLIYTQPDESTAKLQQLADSMTSRNMNKTIMFSEEDMCVSCHADDDTKTSDKDDLQNIDKDKDKDSKPDSKPSLNLLDYVDQSEYEVLEKSNIYSVDSYLQGSGPIKEKEAEKCEDEVKQEQTEKEITEVAPTVASEASVPVEKRLSQKKSQRRR